MVVATDEERVPALPVRSSSREIGQGTTSGSKILLAVVFGGVALAGAGVGVAFQQGLIGATSTAATPRPSSQAHSERRSEFLDVKPADDVVSHKVARQANVSKSHKKSSAPSTTASTLHGEPRTHKQSGARNVTKKLALQNHSGHANVSGIQNHAHQRINSSHVNSTSNRSANSSHNVSHSANHTIQNSTQNATHNVTRNTTNSTVGNSTVGNKTQDHKHKRKHKHATCKGGSLAACQCLFACKVFGAQPSQCSGSKVELLDTLIKKALSSPTEACKGMQCIVRCAKSLKCYDDRVQHDCRALANRSTSEEDSEDGSTCRYECDKDDKNVTLSQ